MNTDGVPLNKSNNQAVWPLFLTVNELEFSKRSKHVVFSSLWFGDAKPTPETFLKPFIEEMNHLHNHCIVWNHNGEECTSKVNVLTASCDAPARALIQNLKQFNGECGCNYCYHPGDVIDRLRGTSRVYPPMEGRHIAT